MEIHLRAGREQGLDAADIAPQHDRLVQAVAVEPHAAHGPVRVRAGGKQKPHHLVAHVVGEVQRLRQRVADVPEGRFVLDQELQAFDIATAHRFPHGAAFVQRRPVIDVCAGGQQASRQGRTSRPSDRATKACAIASHRFRLHHAEVWIGTQGEQAVGNGDPTSANFRVAIAEAREADVVQRQPVVFAAWGGGIGFVDEA